MAKRGAWRRLRRALRLRLSIAAYIGRRMGPPVLGVAAYTLAAASLYRWDLRRTGIEEIDLGEAVYAIYTQLFFEPTEPFPKTPLARLIFWATPVAGAFLIAEGLLKVGASLFDLAARREVWVTMVSQQMRGHVVVCGLGHVGYRVVEELHRLGEEVVAIAQRERGSFVDLVRGLGVPVHVGDARRDDLLGAAGVERARAVVCATGDDLANIEIALDAKRMNPRARVVMRMFDQRLAGKVGDALEFDESFSTSFLAAPLIALQATHPGVLSAYRIGDTVRVTAEVTAGSDWTETTVSALEEAGHCRVVGRREQGGRFATVRPTDLIRRGETLVVDASAKDLSQVRLRLGKGQAAPAGGAG